MAAAFVIGIDLGTTNSVLAYAALHEERANVTVLPIPQLTAPQTIETRSVLPSFLYLATDNEAASGVFRMPWSNEATFATGTLARSLSAEAPDRTVAAAKSWLCHSRVDRRQPILPWQAPDSIPKVSPVLVAQRYLEHLIAAWHQAFPDHAFADQSVVLTVPASFDAAARELTREAALAAGFPESFRLLEEPQAATYAWLDTVGDRWRQLLKVGDRMLICDIGGGTTDLTLVEVAEEQGELVLNRAATGNHLLVGGDNMDLALAHHVAGLFSDKGVTLDPWQSVSLWHQCRHAKETLLSGAGPETHTISIPGRGSRLIGGLVSVTVDRHQATELLLQGFFPDVPITDRPRRTSSSGFRELGLPWETDTAITRHLASFLQQSSGLTAPRCVLFNGGVFRGAALRNRLLSQLQLWFPQQPPLPVEGDEDLDFSVARGACFYGWSREHGGVRIRGGAPRSYYVGIETAGLAVPGAGRPLKALCVVPQGMEEGTEAEVPSGEIGLIVGEPARFRFFSSSARKTDQPGTEVQRWSAEELQETDSLETTLPADTDSEDGWVPVHFFSRITELGILELWCVQETTGKRWKLEFGIRDTAG